jgi:antitoxin MazE
MFKKLVSVGGELGLVLEPSLLHAIGIDEHTLLEVTTEARTLIVRPAASSHDDSVLEVAARVIKVHDATLERLAQ